MKIIKYLINKLKLFNKMKIKIFSLLLLFQILEFIISPPPNNNSKDNEDQLSINIIPSDKYKLNKRDLRNLKDDIERQVILNFKLICLIIAFS